MKFVLKALLFCLVAIAIPFQGYASAAMLACAHGVAPTGGYAPAFMHHVDAAGMTAVPVHHGHEASIDAADTRPKPCSAADAAACAAMCAPVAVIESKHLLVAAADLPRVAPLASPDRFSPDAESTPLERPPRHA